MAKYTLSSGEAIDLSSLSEKEQEHISKIEELITSNIDYFEVYYKAYAPFLEGVGGFSENSLQGLLDSSQYKIILDLLGSYRRKYFSK